MDLKDSIKKQADEIKKHLNAKKPLVIKITGPVCAFDFKEYAESFEWVNNTTFEAHFTDAENVVVSLEDFIRYQMQYSDLAIEIESTFKEMDMIDELRDAQADATADIMQQYSTSNT